MAHGLALGLAFTVHAETTSLSDIRALASQERYEEARRALQSYLESQPEDESARLLEGVLLTRLQRIDEAIDAFQTLSERNPNLPEPHNNLAVLYAAEGRYEDARNALLRAISLLPDYDIARENLGDIYARLADQEYRQAYRINRSNARALGKAEKVATLFEPIAAEENTAAAEALPERDTVAVTPLPESETPLGCLTVNGIDSKEAAAEVVAWLESRGSAAKTFAREDHEVMNYQVYIPPLGSRDAAHALIEKMQQAGVRDLYVIRKGELSDGVSLGVYNSESATSRRVTAIRALGFDAQRRPRQRIRTVHQIKARVSAGTIPAAEIAEAFPKYQLVEQDTCG